MNGYFSRIVSRAAGALSPGGSFMRPSTGGIGAGLHPENEIPFQEVSTPPVTGTQPLEIIAPDKVRKEITPREILPLHPSPLKPEAEPVKNLLTPPPGKENTSVPIHEDRIAETDVIRKEAPAEKIQQPAPLLPNAEEKPAHRKPAQEIPLKESTLPHAKKHLPLHRIVREINISEGAVTPPPASRIIGQEKKEVRQIAPVEARSIAPQTEIIHPPAKEERKMQSTPQPVALAPRKVETVSAEKKTSAEAPQHLTPARSQEQYSPQSRERKENVKPVFRIGKITVEIVPPAQPSLVAYQEHSSVQSPAQQQPRAYQRPDSRLKYGLGQI